MNDQKPDGWVDFKVVKDAVTISQVFEHYGLELGQGKGDERKLCCPLCDSKSRSLAVNTAKQNFHCFACKARGNVLDFVAKKEGCTIKDAAQRLALWFKVGETTAPVELPPTGNEQGSVEPGIYRDRKGNSYEVVIPAALASDLEEMVVYRELFGDYRYWVASLEAFAPGDAGDKPQFTLVKAL